MFSTRRQVFNPVWNQLQVFKDEMNRLFDGSVNSNWGSTEFPAFNVWEEGEELFVEAELPGLDLKDLEIYVTGGNTLTIQGERKQVENEKGIWHRQERVYGRFVRSLTLPFSVDSEKVDARFENGVLKLTLSRHESAKPRKIAVKA
jgi:HSP20 family protein